MGVIQYYVGKCSARVIYGNALDDRLCTLYVRIPAAGKQNPRTRAMPVLKLLYLPQRLTNQLFLQLFCVFELDSIDSH